MRKILSDCHPSFSLENVKEVSNYKIIKSGRLLDLAYQLGAMTRRDCHVALLLTMTIIGLFSFNAQAECTPTPDCASIGYTETSCETDYLACPFDSTKLKCMPCDSSFRYDCTGDNITGGTGSTCGGKYVSCECELLGAVFKNGSCICDTSCSVGNIYYSDGSYSSCADSTKTAIGVVVKDNELVVNSEVVIKKWASASKDTSLPNVVDAETAKADYKGKSNTEIIFEAYPNDTIENNASIYCNSYSTEGTNVGDWYLPAAGELYSYVYGNYGKISVLCGTYWSSTEYKSSDAWLVNSCNGGMAKNYAGGKPSNASVICFLAID